ncbi:tyrosine-type recombinase/integrase [Hymenobacter terrenus]|uniref:tyrosine-type recombinase/integrase n=1 Tax=Hymenobacter terrenus TaxID=1629124 RepID=UPI000619899B|nr:tyrosine-type recombinase/integrase [Hymenobacter terrenus]
MGFAGAFRRSELAALNIEDLKYDGEVLIIRMSRSKTTQNGTGEEKVLYHAQNPLFCPITAYKEWVKQLQGRLQGPVFVSFSRGRTPGTGLPTLKRLSPQSVNDLVHKHLGDFAENVPYTAHSLRASFITTAKLAGQNHDFIRNQTNHKSDFVSPRYTSLTSAVKGNAAKALGL